MAKLPPSGVVAKSESDPELKAMLSQAAENIRLESPPNLQCSLTLSQTDGKAVQIGAIQRWKGLIFPRRW